MVQILRQAENAPVAVTAKRHRIIDQMIYGRRKRSGTLEPMDVKRIRDFEQEFALLKKLVAARDLEVIAM